jgi:hypothetical protein
VGFSLLMVYNAVAEIALLRNPQKIRKSKRNLDDEDGIKAVR